MRVIVIREVVDPEERKLRLHKIAKYAKRHGAHHLQLHRSAGAMDRRAMGHFMRGEQGKYKDTSSRLKALNKMSMGHLARAARSRGLVKKYSHSRGSLGHARGSFKVLFSKYYSPSKRIASKWKTPATKRKLDILYRKGYGKK